MNAWLVLAAVAAFVFVVRPWLRDRRRRREATAAGELWAHRIERRLASLERALDGAVHAQKRDRHG